MKTKWKEAFLNRRNSELWKQMLSVSFLAVCFVSFVSRLALQMRGTVLPLYVSSLDYSKSSAGLITSVYTVTGILFRPLIGRMIDYTGRKKMLAVGLLCIALPLPLYPLAESFVWMCVLSAVCGFGFAVMSTTLATVITDIFSRKYLPQGLGWFGLAATFSVAVGPSVALGTLAALQYAGVFITAGVIGLLSLAALPFIRYDEKKVSGKRDKAEGSSPEDPSGQEPEAPAGKAAWWTQFIEPLALSSSCIVGFATLCGSAITTFLVIYATELGIAGIGTYFTIRAVGLALSRVIVGWLTRKFGNAATLIGSVIVMGLSYAAIFFSRSLPVLLCIAVFESLSCGILQIVCNVTAVLKTPHSRHGRANATYYLFMDIGMGIGSLIWGLVADWTGSTGSMFLGCAFIMVAALLTVLVFRKDFTPDKQ